MTEQQPIVEAMQVVTEALRNDPEYYRAWQANIAMAFQDAYSQRKNSELGVISFHTIANDGATRFLDLLIRVPEKE